MSQAIHDYTPEVRPPAPETLRLRRIRAEAEAAIERLIAMVDELDPDPDLEPTLGFIPPGGLDDGEPDDPEEPSLGSTNGIDQSAWAAGNTEDAEGEDSDLEPSLAALLTQTDQTGWAGGSGDDRDYELDDSDREPDLGALTWATVAEQDRTPNSSPWTLREGDQSKWGVGCTAR